MTTRITLNLRCEHSQVWVSPLALSDHEIQELKELREAANSMCDACYLSPRFWQSLSSAGQKEETQ